MTPRSTALNAICPYFTMFPLDFPVRVLQERATAGEWVLDPFSGRGTTIYAARSLGLPSVGIDSNPVAIALTAAKLANVDPEDVINCARDILNSADAPVDVPQGDFWSLAFHGDVMHGICRLREELLRDSSTDARKALRGVLLGALHGPLTKTTPSHLSNQCTRTYAPKPGYAVQFWKKHQFKPPKVDIASVVDVRARRYFECQRPATGRAVCADSRRPESFEEIPAKARWTITSPPFYGMRTYVPDQWLRNWFVGGPAEVNYSNAHQLDHKSPEAFADQLRSVWINVAKASTTDARLVVRFGGISDRSAEPLEILKDSFQRSPWRLQTVVGAGSADLGRRQAGHFSGQRPKAREEYDAWLRLAD